MATLVVIAAGFAATASCYSPEVRNCALTCNAGNCPDGLECVDGFCVHPGSSCEQEDGGSVDAPQDAGGFDARVTCDVNSPDPLQCDDRNPCTNDHCEAGTCLHGPEDTLSCDDGLFCNGAEACISGSCRQVNDACPQVGAVCNELRDYCGCDDGNPCTTDDRWTPSGIGGPDLCAGDLAGENSSCTIDASFEGICCGGSCVSPSDQTSCGSCYTLCAPMQGCCIGAGGWECSNAC